MAGIGLTAAGCGGGGSPAVSAPPASAHTAAEQAAVTNWLVKTNQMWTDDDFAAVDQVTTGQIRTIYLAEESQASLPKNADRVGFQLTGLSITIPCHTGSPGAFVAYGDTNVFDLGTGMQSVAMVFERLAAGGSWPRPSTIPTARAGRRCARRGPLRRARACSPSAATRPTWPGAQTSAMTGTAQTTRTAAPFAVNDFLAGSGSITVQSATSIRQDRRDRVKSHRALHPDPRPHRRAAAGRRPRLLADRHSHPERYLQRALGRAREGLARRQPGRHAQARRRAPRERHVHHHLHGDRPAAHG